ERVRTEPARGWRRTGAIIGVAAAAACVAEPGVLEPAGPAAAATARLSWLLFGVGAVVFVAFAAALLAAILRSRGPADGRPIRVDGAAERRTVRNVVVAGAIAPAAVLLALYVATLLAL